MSNMKTELSMELMGREVFANPSTSASQVSSAIYQLQYLRAIAAFIVLLYHAAYHVRDVSGDGRMLDIFIPVGGISVGLLFTISGYFMARLSEKTSALSFLSHRLIRVYPIYWLCVALVISISFIFGRTIYLDPSAMLLVPGTRSYVLGIEWTLPFELTFYLMIFGIMIMGLQKKLPIIALGWVLVIEMLWFLLPGLQHGQFPLLFHVPFSLFSLPFVTGLLVPFALRTNMINAASPLIAISLLTASLAVKSVNQGLSALMMALGCALLVAIAVKLGREKTRSPIRPLVALGDWSYALYLIHVPIIILICQSMSVWLASWQLWLLTIVISLIVAVGLGKFDLMLYQTMKSWLDKSRQSVRVILCVSFLGVMSYASTVAYWHYIQARNVVREAAPLGVLISSLTTGEKDAASLILAAKKIGLQLDMALQGYFDNIYQRSPGQMTAQGWMVDTRGGGKIVSMLVFHCGSYLGSIASGEKRPDVAKVLNISEKLSGFIQDLRIDDSCSSKHIDGLIVAKDRHFALVSAQFK